jgi:hypothetical protein
MPQEGRHSVETEAGYCDILRDVTQYLGEIAHPADGGISYQTSKPLIVELLINHCHRHKACP